MPNFAYKAIGENGGQLNGTMEAESAAAVQTILASQGVIPLQVTKTKAAGTAPSRFVFGAPVKTPELLLFTKQMRTLLHAGIPITQVFEILFAQSENKFLKATLAGMIVDVKEGGALSAVFKKHPRVFSDLYCSLIRSGEISGTLPDVLDRLSYILEHEHRVKEDIKSALAYPKMVLIALLGAFFFLLTFVIPKFVSVFEKVGLDLPWPTKICILLYIGLKSYWPLLLGGAALLFLGLRQYFRTPIGVLTRDRILLRLPVVGHLFVKTAMSRFASILSILIASGVSILEALKIIADTIGNSAIAKEFGRMTTQMEEGRGIAAPLRTAQYFPPMVINMVAIGEESGSLEEMLREVARHYDEEVEYATKGLAEAVGPLLIVSLTVVVGFFALAIFLPMWDLTKVVK